MTRLTAAARDASVAILADLRRDDRTRQRLLFVLNVTRVVRARTLGVVVEDFVLAARARGETRLAIVLREILPHVWGTVLIAFSIRTGVARGGLENSDRGLSGSSA